MLNEDLTPEETDDDTADAPAAVAIDLPLSEPLAAGETGPARVEVVAAETPFPITDSAHRASFAVYNPGSAPLTVTDYVLEFVAQAAGQTVVLGADTSATHRDAMRGFTPVGNGMFLFFSGAAGLCIEPLHLAEMPVTVPAHHATTINGYLHGMAIEAALDAAGVAGHAATFALQLRVELADGATLTTEFPIEVVA